MNWHEVEISLLVTAGLCGALQIWWIGSLLRRNHRRRGAEPLSASDFRRELERIFREST